MKTQLLITITHKSPIPDLADKIAGRAYTLDGIENAEAVETGASPAQPTSCATSDDAELPGMWSHSDFTGGSDDRSAQPSQAVDISGEEIMDVVKPFIRDVGNYGCNEPAIPDDGSIEKSARAIITAINAKGCI